MLIFGLGYTGSRLAKRLGSGGWQVVGTTQSAANGTLAFDDDAAVLKAIGEASHILSSIPPAKDGSEPVLDRYGETIKGAEIEWTGYLSSTGVYGDVGGAWVDESAPIGLGRRNARSDADLRWQQLREDVRIFRLPGIYGVDRSPLDRIKTGNAQRIKLTGHVFCRIHVDDIISALVRSFDGPAGVYNICDDTPAPHHEVLAHAARLLGIEAPPLVSLDDAKLSKAAHGFYEESRRVSNEKAKRLLGWKSQYPGYKSGLAAVAGLGAGLDD